MMLVFVRDPCKTRRTMPPMSPTLPLSRLLARASAHLSLTNQEMGQRYRSSRNTVGRWLAGRSTPTPAVIVQIARDVFPIDAALAAGLAGAVNETLETLGLVTPPPPPPPPPGRSLGHLADMVLCAAAETVGQPPGALRPLLVTAFERASAIGLGVEEVLAGLRAGGPKAGT
jgi:transcriptional regulator with XRE-family HTH domain